MIFRTALKMLLETRENIKVVGEADNFLKSVDFIIRNKPNILLIDSPELDSDDFDSYSAKYCTNIPFIVLSAVENIEIVQKCFRLGASGLISKEKSSDTLLKAIEKVSKGELWFDRALMGQTIRQLMEERQATRENTYSNNCAMLTEREREVLTLICRGLKNKAIADNLFISETTVRHHLTSIFDKLEVNSRLQLVVHAFKENLIEIPTKTDEAPLNKK